MKDNKTYQIVYTGNSNVAMDGAGIRLTAPIDCLAISILQAYS